MPTPRILLVDDDPALLQALSDTLRRKISGLVVDVCESARTALTLLERHDYDAIVSDIRMPGMDGLTLMSHIQNRHPKIPVLLITGHGDREVGIRALRHGAYAYMEKPLDREFIAAWVNRAIEMRQLSRAMETQRLTLEQYVQNVEGVVQERLKDALEHREHLSALLDIAPCILLMTDPDGQILVYNQAAEELIGYRREEVLGKNVQEFVPASWWPIVQQRLGDIRTAEFRQPHEIPCISRDGAERRIEWRCTTFHSPRYVKPCILAAGIDVSQRGGVVA
jgi:PAS domain S-box-containing protein